MQCLKCQAEIPAGAPEGLCPQCLLQAALASKTADSEPKTAAYTPTGSGFVPPTPEALQAAFPQLEILELLGKGGMGAVYKARQPGLDRLVAVKILPPEVGQDPAFAERFTREARALAMLNHPNIVGIYDSGKAGGYYYFVMEFLDGVNLRQAMRAGELKAAEALKIVPQICEALQFAHDEGIVHRDIKPENILLDKKGCVKIADFGLAKLLGKTAPDISLTGTQQVMGTMHYMAPEQFEGSRDVDHRADIYSLGVTFYEMLTGELPIGRFAAPSKKVQIDVRLDEVVLRSLEKEPEQRYQHASEIKTEVETIARGPVAAAQPPFTEASGSPARTGYLRAVVLPMAMVIGVFGLVVIVAIAINHSVHSLYLVWSGSLLADAICLRLNGVWLYRAATGECYVRNVVCPFVVLCLLLLPAGALCMVLFERSERFYPLAQSGALAQNGSVLALAAFIFLNGAWIYRSASVGFVRKCVALGWSVFCVVLFVAPWTLYETDRDSSGHMLYVGVPLMLAVWGVGLWLLLRYGRASNIETEVPPPGNAEPKTEVAASEPSGAGSQSTYLRAVAIPMAVVFGLYGLVAFVVPGLGFPLPGWAIEIAHNDILVVWGAFLVAAVCLSLNGVWLYRATAVGGYLRTVVIPFAVLCIFLVPAVFLFTIVSRSRNGGDYEWGDPGEWAQIGAALAGLAFVVLNAVWVFRTIGFGFVWKCLPFAWTVLCVVLFVVLWKPYESGDATGKALLDRGIWPYHGTSECAVSLEPTVPTFQRIVIREKAGISLKGSLGPNQTVTKLIYRLELQPLKGERHILVVDALDGMSWAIEEPKEVRHERSGSLLDATSLAAWLRAGDVDAATGDPKEKGDALMQKMWIQKRSADHASQARALVDIIRRAAKFHAENTLHIETRGQTHHVEVHGEKWINRLHAATDQTLLDGNQAFIRNPGWNSTENVNWEPVVPILYVGVPLMLAVWGVGLWLLLRRRGAKV